MVREIVKAQCGVEFDEVAIADRRFNIPHEDFRSSQQDVDIRKKRHSASGTADPQLSAASAVNHDGSFNAVDAGQTSGIWPSSVKAS